LRPIRWIAATSVAVALVGAGFGFAADKVAPIVRKLPPPGIEISAADRSKLQTAIDGFAAELEDPRVRLSEFLPDVEIYLNAAAYALANDEFYDPREVKRAHEMLALGKRRLDELTSGKPSWPSATGLLVRGFKSKLDGSIQPYGLVIPPDFDPERKIPLYVWLKGRGDKATEMSFIAGRQSRAGEMQPAGAIVLHPFARYCNGFKLAGEIDVLEAIEAVKDQYPIDDRRIVLCGFSMGGAGAWHLGAHYPDVWCAVSPGAGFAETARYQNLTPDKYPPWYEQKLWGWYDVPDYVRNLFNLPVVAYSGELDKQIQSARVMEEAYAREGRKLPHIIGPGMGHKYHPDSLAELHRLLAGYAAKGRSQQPAEVSLQTRTLRYNRVGPIEVLGLKRHWEDSRVDAKLDSHPMSLKTRNVSALQIHWPGSVADGTIMLDGQKLTRPVGAEETIFQLSGAGWQTAAAYPSDAGLHKLHGLQGPIDDAFMEPFLVVTPSGKSDHPQVEHWVQAELVHFIDRWRRLFRGQVRIKPDTNVTDADMRMYHLIVWGDPTSNKILQSVRDRLPIRWSAETIRAGEQNYPASGNALVMIYPNPRAPNKYIVVNSGFTFREGHDGSNSLQNAKLPDWAIVDLSQPPSALGPGKIADAGFFDERWQFTADRGKSPEAAKP
jgi:dienelactone hydrolase